MNKVRELQRLFIGVVRDERGLAIVMVSLAMAVLLGMTALVVDVGAMTLQKNRLANACDAAAMAGAWKLPHEGQAPAEAINFTGKNGVSSPDVVKVKILNDSTKEVKGWYLKDASPTGNVTIDPNKDPNADGFGMRGVSLSN